MRPEALTVQLRPRLPYEAIDLGLALVQTHARALYAAWAAVLVPVIALATLLSVLWPDQDWIWWTLLWWLKPLYDRVLLRVLSHGVFGETVRARTVWRSIPGFFRGGLLRALTWGRLSAVRSFLLPVWQLEGLRGAARKRRIAVLGRGSRGAAVWLTVTCVHLEMALGFAAFILVLAMLPAEANVSLTSLVDGAPLPLWMAVWTNAAYLVGLLLIEPLYVAAGFTLYLNRRTELEGWDLELAFRQIAARVDDPGAQAA